MVPAGSKAKRLSSVNHTTKTIHPHYHHHHHRHHLLLDFEIKVNLKTETEVLCCKRPLQLQWIEQVETEQL